MTIATSRVHETPKRAPASLAARRGPKLVFIVTIDTDLRHDLFGIYHRYNCRDTLNTDERLMIGTTMTQEFKLARQAFKLCVEGFEQITINSMKSASIPHHRRIRLIENLIKPGYSKAKASLKRRPRSSS